jgi:hypothetical protein
MQIQEKTPRMEEIAGLLDDSGWPCVSIHTPTGRTSEEAETSRIRFKNQIHQAADRLMAGGLRGTEAARLLAPLRRVLGDPLFWQHQTEGLSIFRSPEAFQAVQLPYRVPEVTIVARDFHIVPLLPILGNHTRFFLLDLDLHNVELFEGDSFGIRRLELGSQVPAGMGSLPSEQDSRMGQQWHTGAPSQRADRSAPGQSGPLYHGHGENAAQHKDRILQYFRHVDRAVVRHLAGSQVPLLVAGVEYLLPIYQEANHYPHLMSDGIPIKTDDMPEEEEPVAAILRF